jgi:hypothetical protein
LAASMPAPALRTQLAIPDGQGLVIENVAPDGPAAKGGIKQYDVLLRAGDRPLGTVLDLIDAVNKAQEKELAVELMRGGQKRTLSITPVKRPAGVPFQVPVPGAGAAEMKILQDWMSRFGPPAAPGGPFQIDIIQPGVILPPGTPLPPGMQGMGNVSISTVAALPDGYQVAITRESGKPAKIVLTKGKEKWEAVEGDLGKLPEKVRPEVEKMLRATATSGIRAFAVPVAGAPPDALHPIVPQDMERRLQEINRELVQLRKAVEELKAVQSQHKSGEKE